MPSVVKKKKKKKNIQFHKYIRIEYREDAFLTKPNKLMLNLPK